MNNKNINLIYFLNPIIKLPSIIEKSKESIITTHKLRKRLNIKGFFLQKNLQPDLKKCLKGGGIFGFWMLIFTTLFMGTLQIFLGKEIMGKNDIFDVKYLGCLMGVWAIGGVVWGVLFYILVHGMCYYLEEKSHYWQCSFCDWKSERVYRQSQTIPICRGIVKKLEKFTTEIPNLLYKTNQLLSANK